MEWLNNLLSWWASFANTAATWSYKSTTWVWPLNQLTGFFTALSTIIDAIFKSFLGFSQWTSATVQNIQEFFTWKTIIAWYSNITSSISGVITWFSSWSQNVSSVISIWWSGIASSITQYIDTKTEGLPKLLDDWGNFFTVTLPGLFDLKFAEEWWRSKFIEVGQVINSAFMEHSDLWNGWTDFRQHVSDFFTAPLDWLEDKFTDWFLGGK